MNQQQGKKLSRHIAKCIAKCWADEDFKRKLLADPTSTLKAEGVDWPAGLSIKVLENDDKVFNLVIPARPIELSDETKKVADSNLARDASGILAAWWLGVGVGLAEGAQEAVEEAYENWALPR